MAGFLLGLGEMIVEGIAGGFVSNVANEAIKTFKPIVAKKVGDEIVSYSASHPKGFIVLIFCKPYTRPNFLLHQNAYPFYTTFERR